MKIIIFFVLAGLSLATDFGCEPDLVSDRQCVIQAVQNVPDLLKKLQEFLCEYKDNIENNEENYKKFAGEFIKTLALAGCGVDQLLCTSKTFEELSIDIGELSAHLVYGVDKILNVLGISEGLTQILCDVAGDALASECLKHILQNLTPDLIEKVNALVCEKNRDALSSHDLIVLLKEAGCFGDDLLHTDDALENLLEDTSTDLRDLLDHVLDALQNLIANSSLLTKLGCDLISILKGKVPVINLGGALG
ncbi:ranaspumin-like [Rhinoderma darwinii]|uniref:ranaspumin-like n=1 Tax=Rhinoderma darwinii TaxID=43563 RepID=UPI003F67A680